MFIVLDDYYEENIAAHLSLGLIEWEYIKIDRSFLLYTSGNDDCLKSLMLQRHFLLAKLLHQTQMTGSEPLAYGQQQNHHKPK